MHKLIINFTPTGMIPTKVQTPHVPIYPNEIIEQVHEVYEVGITLAHLHARDKNGIPTYQINVYRDIVEGIRKHCPDLVIGVSLSGRNSPEFEKRSEVLALQPDMGSLTLSSLNFSKHASMNSPDMIQKLALKMSELGVKPELECFDGGMIHYSKYLIKKDILKPPFYFNLLVGNIFNTQLDLASIGLMIRDLPDNSYWSLAGLGRHQLAANTIAIATGGGVRVGLEDNIWWDAKRTQLATNLGLVKRIHQIAALSERPIMGGKEFGELGFYNSKFS